MANIKIAIWNKSTVLDDAAVSAALPALQIQIHRDFAPIWGVDADLAFSSKNQQPAAGSWWLVVLDDSDVAGDLGYHELTDEGLPLGYVFARTDQQAGLKWTVTASHELLEMLGDPDINLYAFVQTGNNTGTFYSYEVCDPCELDEQGYQIDGVQVSDFVYPQWFEGFRAQGSTQFDFQKLIDQPFKLSPGGYSSALDVPSGLGWYQINIPAPAGTHSRRQQAPMGSRRERRSRTRDQWAESVVKRNSSGSAQ
jgi:hypothetical protein